MLEKTYNRLSDEVERFMSQWWGALIFCAAALYSKVYGGTAGLDEFLTNTGTFLVVILLNQGYRSDKAMHVKLDAVDPCPERNNLEARTAREIDELRDQSNQGE